jgi:hypothetical protein
VQLNVPNSLGRQGGEHGDAYKCLQLVFVPGTQWGEFQKSTLESSLSSLLSGLHPLLTKQFGLNATANWLLATNSTAAKSLLLTTVAAQLLKSI